MARWISGLALNTHVNCKLSGLLMPVLGFGYEHSKKSPSVAELVGRLSPMIEHCIDAFGPERCMVASNFPVDKVAVTYETMTKAMLEMTHRYGLEAQQAMFAGTAETFYGSSAVSVARGLCCEGGIDRLDDLVGCRVVT